MRLSRCGKSLRPTKAYGGPRHIHLLLISFITRTMMFSASWERCEHPQKQKAMHVAALPHQTPCRSQEAWVATPSGALRNLVRCQARARDDWKDYDCACEELWNTSFCKRLSGLLSASSLGHVFLARVVAQQQIHAALASIALRTSWRSLFSELSPIFLCRPHPV